MAPDPDASLTVASPRDVEVRVSSELEDPEWDGFLRSIPGNHHPQSSPWARFKSNSGWKPLRIVLSTDRRIVGGVQVLHRRFRGFGTVGYAPRGPVLQDGDLRLGEQVLQELDRAVRARQFAYLAVQPPAACAHTVPLLRQRGFSPTPLQTAPTATVLVDLSQTPEERLARMRKGTRRAIHSSLNNPLNIRRGTEADIGLFHSLMVTTAARRGFTAASADFYHQLWRAFSPGGHCVLFLAELAGEPVAGELDIAFGDTVVSKRAGWSGQHSRFHPNEKVIWSAMNWAVENGYKHYDLEGLDPALARALLEQEPSLPTRADKHHLFKLGFGGQVLVLPENHERCYGRAREWAYRTLWGTLIPAAWRGKLLERLRLG